MRPTSSVFAPSRLTGGLAVVVLSVVLSSAPVAAQTPEPFDPIDEFLFFCLEPDGNLERVEDRAPAHGYVPVQERVEAFRPLGGTNHATYTYAWAREVDGHDIQVMARPSGFVRSGGVTAYFNVCSVAVRGQDRGRMRTLMARELGMDSFRQRGTSVFAWFPEGEGRAAIRRKVFEHAGAVALVNRGMRMVTVADHGDQVILSYFAPGRDCRVLSEYAPDAPNIYCDRVVPDDRRRRR